MLTFVEDTKTADSTATLYYPYPNYFEPPCPCHQRYYTQAYFTWPPSLSDEDLEKLAEMVAEKLHAKMKGKKK